MNTQNTNEMQFITKKKLCKNQINFYYKLAFVIIMTFFVFYGLFNGIISSLIGVNQLNKFIVENKCETINSIIEKTKELLTNEEIAKHKWVTRIYRNGEKLDFINPQFKFVSGNDWSLKAFFAPGEFIFFYFSFFTILSNILTIIWMLISIIKPNWEGRKGIVNFQGATIIAAFITITSLIFNFALTPMLIIEMGSYFNNNAWTIIEQTFLHTVGPIAFVIYICVFSNYNLEKKENKHMYKTWKYGIASLIGYGVYTAIRGTLKYFGGNTKTDFFAWPYFFTQILVEKNIFFGLPGWLTFAIFVLIIALIFIAFQTLYWKLIIKFRIKKIQ